MKPLTLAVAGMTALGVPAFAQELCIEPIRPEAVHLLDSGFTGAEVRVEFRRYFNEVEVYLNCLNEASGRIREDARAAAYDLQQVLETTEPSPGDQGSQVSHPASVELKDTGELFLDYPLGRYCNSRLSSLAPTTR